MPTMLFFVIPLSFFIACALGLSRLSFDYELPVLFALGMEPWKIIKIFLPIAALSSLSLIVLSIVLTPLSDLAYQQFLQERKNNININLQAGEFGQRLDKWLIYAQTNQNNIYQNIVLLSLAENKKDRGIIIANEANLNNINGIMEVTLDNGKIYRKLDNAIEQIAFEQLILRHIIQSPQQSELGLIEYWHRAFYPNQKQDKIQRNLSLYISISLFPIISVFYYLLLGVKNPRYQRNYTILQAMAIVGIFFCLAYLCANYMPAYTILIYILWMFGGYMLYWRFVGRFY